MTAAGDASGRALTGAGGGSRPAVTVVAGSGVISMPRVIPEPALVPPLASDTEPWAAGASRVEVHEGAPAPISAAAAMAALLKRPGAISNAGRCRKDSGSTAAQKGQTVSRAARCRLHDGHGVR